MGDQKNAREWIALANEGASDKYQAELRWLEITALLAEGKRDEASEMLKQFKSVDSPNMKDYYNSVAANYWLMDFPETIQQFEQAEALREKLEMKPMSKGSMDSYIYASYAYQQLEQLDKSRDLIKLISSEQDRVATSPGRVSADIWYQKSLLQAIEGESQMALITLQRAIDEGWTQPLQIMEEPILRSLKSDSNFKAMLAGLETRMNLMREQLVFEESFNSHWKS